MSDIPSGALDGEPESDGRSSLLSRVILPAPGRAARRPQALHRGVGHQRPPGARAHPHHAGDRRRVRGVVRDLLQRLPGQLLAAVVDAGVGGAAGRADRQRPRRRLPLQGHRRADHVERHASRQCGDGPMPAARRVRDRAGARSRTAAGSGSTSPPTPRSRCTAPAGTRRCPRPGRANIAVGIPTFNRPTDCVNALRRPDLRSVGGQGDRRRDRVRPGHAARCATIPTSPRPRRRWATGCPSTTSPTSAAPAATAGSCTRR